MLRDIWVAEEGQHALAGRVNTHLHICCIRKDGEVIRTEMHDRPTAEHLLQDILDVLQAEIPLPEAMRGIVEMKIRDIKKNRAGLDVMPLPPLLLQALSRSLQEFLPSQMRSSRVCNHTIFLTFPCQL